MEMKTTRFDEYTWVFEWVKSVDNEESEKYTLDASSYIKADIVWPFFE